MRKILTTLVGVMFLGWLCGVMAVRQYFTLHRPESPQPEFRRTVAVQLNYGKTVYVTPGENGILYCANEWIAVPLVVVFIYAAFRINKSKPRAAT
jgi:hypothetical protein